MELDIYIQKCIIWVRDRLLIPQVLFFSVRENGGGGGWDLRKFKTWGKTWGKWGEGGGLKQKKLVENDENFRRMTKTLFNMKLVWVSINTWRNILSIMNSPFLQYLPTLTIWLFYFKCNLLVSSLLLNINL